MNSFLNKIISILFCAAVFFSVLILTGKGADKSYSTFSGRIQPCYSSTNSKEKTVIIPPADVTVVAIKTRTVNSVKFTWKRVNGADGYVLYKYNPSKKKWETIASVNSSTNNYTFSNLDEYTKYGFTVKAFKVVDGKKVLSKSCTPKYAYTLFKRPEDVTGFKVTSRTASTINLSWNKSKTADGYVLYRYNAISKSWEREAKITKTSYSFSKLSSGQKYNFTIRSYRTVNGREVLSANRPTVNVTTLLDAVNNIAVSPSYERITLTWDKTRNADGYILYKYDLEQKAWQREAIVLSGVNSYTFNNLQDNTKYYFAVKALKGLDKIVSYSESYEPIKAKTSAHTVTGLKVIVSDGRARLSWNKNANVDFYYIFPAVSDDNASSSSILPINTTTGNNYVFKDLTPGVEYTFTVAGYDEINGFDSSSVKASTLPRAVYFTAQQNGDSLNLELTKRNEADEYEIMIMLPGEDWKTVGITTELTYTVDNLDYDKFFVSVRSRINRNGAVICGDYVKKCIQKDEQAKSIYSDGDSIAFGQGSNGHSYVSQFAENHNYSLINNAISKGTLSSDKAGYHHIGESVIENVNDNFDYIILEGGVNDYFLSSPLGNITPDGETEFDMNTTCGALEAALYHIKNNCPDSKVYFVSVHKVNGTDTPNDYGLTYEDYKTAIDEICLKYGVTVIDCYNCGMDSSYTYTRNGVYPTGDGVHPNEEGYEKYYLPLLESVIE